MKIAHNFKKPNIQIEKNKIRKDAFAILTNNKGGFLNISDKVKSRYEGWFFSDENFNTFKIIENIEPISGGPIKKIENNYIDVERERPKTKESFFIPRTFNSLVYKISQKTEVEITLDIRKIYENPQFGKIYNISEKDKTILIEFIQENDFKMYLAVKGDYSKFKKIENWKETNYPYDKERNSPPFNAFVYKAFSIEGSEFVFSVSKSKDKAIEEAKSVFNKIEKLKTRKEKELLKIFDDKIIKVIKDKEVRASYLSAKSSLNSLLNYTGAKVENRYNLFAGIPWFVQFWNRDELISLKALFETKILTNKQAKILVFDTLKDVGNDGRLSNTKKNIYSETQSADAIGWLFKRVEEMYNQKKLNLLEKREVSKKIKNILKKLENNYTEDGFAIANGKSTWMDSIERGNKPIEIQALRLLMYKLAFNLTGKVKYNEAETLLKEKVRAYFWNGELLADSLNDFTVRPNIFLAFYIYPELLSEEEWSKCFKNTIKHLWLNWGGFSTISKEDDSFQDLHTGEDPQSYHNGDSWFFINYMAGISMHRLDKQEFGKYINKIIETGYNDILYEKGISHASEVSSAKKFTPAGSISQAWSVALYIELINEVYKI